MAQFSFNPGVVTQPLQVLGQVRQQNRLIKLQEEERKRQEREIRRARRRARSVGIGQTVGALAGGALGFAALGPAGVGPGSAAGALIGGPLIGGGDVAVTPQQAIGIGAGFAGAQQQVTAQRQAAQQLASERATVRSLGLTLPQAQPVPGRFADVPPEQVGALLTPQIQAASESPETGLIAGALQSPQPLATLGAGVSALRALNPPTAAEKAFNVIGPAGSVLASAVSLPAARQIVATNPGSQVIEVSGRPVLPKAPRAAKTPFEGLPGDIKFTATQTANRLLQTLPPKLRTPENFERLRNRFANGVVNQRLATPGQRITPQGIEPTQPVDLPLLERDLQDEVNKIRGITQAAPDAVSTPVAPAAPPPLPLIPEEVPKGLEPTAAARAQGAKQGIQLIRGVRNQLVDEQGNVDRTLVATMNANIPFTEGRKLRQQYLDSLEARIRIESGAAVPQEEIERLAARFMPSVLDSDEAIIDKMNRAEQFFAGTLQLIEFGRGVLSENSLEKLRDQEKNQIINQFNLER